MFLPKLPCLILQITLLYNLFTPCQSAIKARSTNEEREKIAIDYGNIYTPPTPEESENSASFGFMFDLKVNKMITVMNFEFYTRFVEEVEYQVYTVPGEYVLSKHDLELWTLVAQGRLQGQGLTKPTKIEEMSPVFIPADMVQGFYLTLQTQNLVFLSTSKRLGEYSEINSDVAIGIGSGVSSYPLGGNLFEPRSFVGSITYYIMEYASLAPSAVTPMPSITSTQPTFIESTAPTIIQTKSPTTAPSSAPTELIQHLSTNQTITLYGTDLKFMDPKTQEAFCNEIKASIQQDLMEKYNDLSIEELYPTNQLLLGEEYNEIGISVTAHYNSHMELDFASIFKSYFWNSRMDILVNLQRDNSYFESVQRIASVPTSDLEEEYQIANVNQSISLVYPQENDVIYMDTSTMYTFENEVVNFFHTEIQKVNPDSYVVMAFVTSQNMDDARLDTWVTIQAKFLGEFNLLEVMEDIMKNDNARLYYQLKDSGEIMFRNLEGIDFVKNETVLPTSPPTSIQEESTAFSMESIKDFLLSTMGYVVMGVTGFVILVIIIILCVYCNCCCCCYEEEYLEGGDALTGVVIKVADDRTAANSSYNPDSSIGMSSRYLSGGSGRYGGGSGRHVVDSLRRDYSNRRYM